MRVLLIAPDFDPDSRLERNAKFANHHQGSVAPLGLATVAALTPEDVEVDLWDEAVRSPIRESTVFPKQYDLVGVTGYDAHIERVTDLGRLLRKRGFTTAVGGPGVSAAPEQYRNIFDILFIGEAEQTWPRFVADWKRGKHRIEYRQVTRIDMAHSPVPRWDLIAADLPRYRTAAVQTTRGCPFDCEFCNVTYLFGRTARHKSAEQVVEEVRQLERLGARKILFCDDNLIGNPTYAKEMLKALITLNRTFRRPMQFFTNVTLNVARNKAILGLLAEANFIGVYIGIESVNVDSLIETNKPQNYRTDMAADIRTIQSYGLPIEAGMVVGFDHDDASIFERQLEFLERNGIAGGTLNMLNAPVGTKLWTRLKHEGRVVDTSGLDASGETLGLASVRTNINPKQMTRTELLRGYRDLLARLRSWPSFERRIKGMVAQVSAEAEGPIRLARQQRFEEWKAMIRMTLDVFRSTDFRGRAATLRILLHTWRQARFMLPRVAGLIRRHAHQVSCKPALLAAIEREIEREGKRGAGWGVLQTAATPARLRKAYRDWFGQVHERVSEGFDGQGRDHEVLVRIACTFFSDADDALPDEDLRAALFETAERVVAQEGGARPSSSATVSGFSRPSISLPAENPQAARLQFELRRLADDVIREAEKDLRRSVPVGSLSLFVIHNATSSRTGCEVETES